MIGHKVRVEERPSRPEPEQGRGRSSLAALLVDVDERLVDGTGERDLNVLAALGVDEVWEVALGRVEEGLEAELGQGVRELKRLLDLELWKLDVEVVNLEREDTIG